MWQHRTYPPSARFFRIYFGSRKVLGTGIYGLLREKSNAPISYIVDENAPEVEVGGKKYAVGCGLSQQVR